MTIQLVVPERREGGVYDFSNLLAGALREQGEDVELVHLDAASALSWRPSERVVVQYSGYGFAKRGAPVWLLATLAAKRRQIRRLGVFFHELYAEGPPSTSAFWLSPAQKGVARGLAELCDFWMTSREGSAAWLRRYAGDKPHGVLPVFSTIGETADLPEERERALVVFGSPGLRLLTYQAAGEELFAFARREGFTIRDIGAPLTDSTWLARLNAERVETYGTLQPMKVRQLLAASRMGLVAYPAAFAAKSSVFAAYAAHAVCPILYSESHHTHDALRVDENYLGGLPPSSAELEDTHLVGRRAAEWYQSHQLRAHSVRIAEQCCASESGAAATDGATALSPTDTQPTSAPNRPERASDGLHAYLTSILQLEASLPDTTCALDIGCGTGAWLVRMAGLGIPRLVGVDRELPPAIKGVTTAYIDLDRGAPADLGRFDVVTCIEVIEHVENVGHLLDLFADSVAAKGLVLLSTPNIESLRARVRHLLTGRLPSFDDKSDPTHLFPIHRTSLARALSRRGLEITATYQYPVDSRSSVMFGAPVRVLSNALRLALPDEAHADVIIHVIRPSRRSTSEKTA